jgi:hypothetical protein
MPRSVEGRLATALLVIVGVSVSIQFALLQDEAGLIDAAREGTAKHRNQALFRLEVRGTGSPALEELVRSALFDDDPDVACFAWMRHARDGTYAAEGLRAIASRTAAEQQRWRLVAHRTKRLEDLEACLDRARHSTSASSDDE